MAVKRISAYECDVCNEIGTGKYFKRQHTETPVTGADLRSCEVFWYNHPVKSADPSKIIIISKVNTPDIDHKRVYEALFFDLPFEWESLDDNPEVKTLYTDKLYEIDDISFDMFAEKVFENKSVATLVNTMMKSHGVAFNKGTLEKEVHSE
ncbi:MAG: hypothetical protein GY861_09490 [bacterium]|nr:hypothetical protein [bacterium]